MRVVCESPLNSSQTMSWLTTSVILFGTSFHRQRFYSCDEAVLFLSRGFISFRILSSVSVYILPFPSFSSSFDQYFPSLLLLFTISTTEYVFTVNIMRWFDIMGFYVVYSSVCLGGAEFVEMVTEGRFFCVLVHDSRRASVSLQQVDKLVVKAFF